MRPRPGAQVSGVPGGGRGRRRAAAMVPPSQQGGLPCISGAYRLGASTMVPALGRAEAGPGAPGRPWHASAPTTGMEGRGGTGPPPLPPPHAHARLVRVEAPVDVDLFADAAYYGADARAALVHAPRHWRVPGPHAVAARLGRPATLILLPSPPTPGLHDLVRVLWRSLHEAGAHRTGIAFVAQSRQGFDAASAVAAQAVLLVRAGRGGGGGGDGGGEDGEGAPLSFAGNCVEAGVPSQSPSVVVVFVVVIAASRRSGPPRARWRPPAQPPPLPPPWQLSLTWCGPGRRRCWSSARTRP